MIHFREVALGKSMGNVQQILSGMFLFHGVDTSALEIEFCFLDQCELKEYAAGDIIQSAAHPLDGLAYLHSGTASVLSDASDKCVLLRNLASGDVFGASTIYSDVRGYNTVICADAACTVFIIPAVQVKRIISANSVVAENYIRFLTERICFLNRKISAFTAGSAESKLAVYLLGLPQNADGTVMLRSSLSDLADMLNMGRASLYRAFDALSMNGILVREGKKIILLDRNALRNIF